MTNLLDAASALKELVNAQRQNNRLLRLSFPHNDAPPEALMVANRLDAYEGISRDFHTTIEVLADKPDIALKEVLGKMVTIELVRDDGSLRYFNGYVFDFRFVKNDAGFSYYDMVLLPWLAFLRYRHDNYLFHGKSVEEQTALIFGDYPMRDWKRQLLGEDPPMTDACQFDETDYNYLHRRWEAKGWHYWYEHRKDGHTLMLSGDSTQAGLIDAEDGRITWQGKSGVTACGLWNLSPVRTVASTHYAAASFDFKNPRPAMADIPTLNKQGPVPPLEVYEYAGAYGYKNRTAGDAFVRLRMEEIEAGGKHFEARGDDDRAQCGRAFVLTGHRDPLALAGGSNDDDTFFILDVRHSASNNYETREGGAAAYENTLTCIRKKIPWRPGRGFNSTREIQGARLQQLRFDDTAGQISTQVACDHASSQINLGDLRHARNNGKADPRGEGLEARSDAAVAIRGGQGVLISSDARPHAQGSQLDRAELIGLAQVLQGILEQLGDLAATHRTSGTDPGKFRQLLQHLEEWHQGTNTAPGQGPGGAPIVAISAAAGAGIFSQDNLLLGAQSNIDAVSAGHTQISAGKQLRQHAADGISAFAHQGGIQAVAGQGLVDIQAHQGNINLTASDTITLTAGTKVVIQAPEVHLVSQGAQTTWSGGAIVEEAGSGFVVKSPCFAQTSGGGGMPAGVNLPVSTLKTDEKYMLRLRGAGTANANRRYRIELDDGRSMEGRSDSQGRTQLAQAEAMHIAHITLFDD